MQTLCSCAAPTYPLHYLLPSFFLCSLLTPTAMFLLLVSSSLSVVLLVSHSALFTTTMVSLPAGDGGRCTLLTFTTPASRPFPWLGRLKLLPPTKGGWDPSDQAHRECLPHAGACSPKRACFEAGAMGAKAHGNFSHTARAVSRPDLPAMGRFSPFDSCIGRELSRSFLSTADGLVPGDAWRSLAAPIWCRC